VPGGLLKPIPGWPARLASVTSIPSEASPRATNRLLGAPPLNGVLISNYVRVLVSSLVAGPTLYTDIDFAFSRPLDWVFEKRSFVYRWEHHRFGNAALLFATRDSPIKNGHLLRLVERLGSGRSFIVFSDENCRALGIDILPCDRLDPLWSMRGSFVLSDFFVAGARSPHLMARFREEFDAVHWHNQWKVQPERGSPYDLWMREVASGNEVLGAGVVSSSPASDAPSVAVSLAYKADSN
jgi:hypothetical protein